MKKVTLQDIANELGISKGTVDRAIHNRGDINPKTRDRVMELVKKYNYIPDRAARTLSLRAKKIRIGILLQNDPGFFWDNIKNGIRKAEAEFLGGNIELIFKNLKNFRQADDIAGVLNDFIRDRVDAIMLVPSNNAIVKEKIDEACSRNIPVVTINDDVDNSKRLFYVGPQMQQSGRLAAELMGRFLQNKGNVIVINGDIESLEYQERLEGFNQVIKEKYCGIKVAADYVYTPALKVHSNNKTIECILYDMDHIDGIYDVDGASLFDIAALLKPVKMKKNTVLVGHEIWSGVGDFIAEGVIDACISQDPYSQGYFSMKLLYSYLIDGKKPGHERFYTRLDVVLKENMIVQNNIINPYYMGNT